MLFGGKDKNMKLTKRILATVLALVMLVPLLAGCSSTEIEYLDMLVDMYKKSELSEAKSEVVITPNREIVAELLNTYGYSVSAEALPEVIYITMTAQNDTNQNVQIGDMVISVPGIIELGYKAVVTADVTYVGDFYIKSDSIDIESLIYSYASTDETAFLAYNAFLGLSDIKFIEIPTSQDENSVTVKLNSDDYEWYIEAFKALFSDFSVGAVSKTDNGFKFTYTAESIYNIIKNGISYLANNADALVDFIVKVIDKNRTLILSINPEILPEDIDFIIEELKNSEYVNELKVALEEIATKLITEDAANAVSAFDGSFINIEVVEKDGIVTTNTEAVFSFAGLVFGTVDSMSVETPVEEIAFPELNGYSATIESLSGYFDTYGYLAESHPLETMLITWDGYEGLSQVYGTFADVDMLVALGLYDFHNIDGSMYLPMRRICERFGEVVDWDPELGRAYVIRGEEKIDMTGVLIGGRTFIKIRDFEKLGYLVDYQVDENGVPWAILAPQA